MRSYKTAFILAPTRSGSTLLDNLLASHPSVVSLGEVDKLRAYAVQDRRLYNPKQPLICSCGSPVPDCSFWRQVEATLGTPLGNLSLQWPPANYARESLPIFRRRVLDVGVRLLARQPGLFRSNWTHSLFGSNSIVSDSWRLFDAVHAVTGAACVVDASKALYRFRTLWHGQKDAMRAIVLCRDYRAVTHSQMRRGRSIEQAIGRWRRSMRLIEEMVSDIPDNFVLRLKYEALCEDPDATIRQTWRFLQLPESSTAPRRSVSDMHHISGSPSKFDLTRQSVRVDDAYTGAFDPAQLEYLRIAAQPYSLRWGYD